MRTRTLTTGYVQAMRSEDAPLAEAYAEYAAEARLRLKASTWRTYDHYIPAFLASGATALRDLTPLRVKAFVNQYAAQGKVHGAHNAMIALRAFSHWLAKDALSDPRSYRSTYELTDARRVAVFSEGFGLPGSLGMAELPSGEVRLLFPVADGPLVAGPGLLLPFPVERRFEFSELDDGRFRRVRVRSADGGAIEGRRLALREEEVAFRNGDVTLVGTLVLPPGDGPHPAIVVAHGSGDVVRDDPFAHVLAEQGFAFFRYDQRGVGASYADSPMEQNSWGWSFFRLINDHDPIPVLERILRRERRKEVLADQLDVVLHGR